MENRRLMNDGCFSAPGFAAAAELGAGLLRELLGICPAGLVVFDQQGRYLAANRQAAEFAGEPIDTLIGKHVRELMPAFSERIEYLLRKTAAGGGPQDPIFLEGYGEGQGARPLRRWRASFFPLPFANEVYVVMAVVEVPDAGEVADRGRELHFLFHSLIEQSPDAIFVKDAQNRYRYINPAGARMLGQSVEKVIGQDDFALFSRPVAEKMWARDRFIMRGPEAQRTYDDEDEVGGRRVIFQTTKSPLRSVHGEVLGLTGISREVTAQREQEEERLALIEKLEEAKRQLEEEREMRQRLVANLGHDLRSPLSVAKMASQFLAETKEIPEPTLSFVGRMRCALDRIDSMIRDLLDSSRAEAGHGWELTKVKMDLRSTLLEALQQLSIVYPGRLQFRQIEESAPVLGIWEKSAIQRILENLVHNAIRHGDASGPVTLRLISRPEEEYAGFSVHNYGEPIRVNTEDLFQRFRREQTSKPGWGLGLTIVKSLVEVHGGHVAVDSTETEGTCFTVNLPLS
jgi:PAS domain S-box-containing protein